MVTETQSYVFRWVPRSRHPSWNSPLTGDDNMWKACAIRFGKLHRTPTSVCDCTRTALKSFPTSPVLLPTKLYKGVAGVLTRVAVIGLRVSNYSAQTPRTLHSTSRSASKWAILFFSIFLRWDSITKTFSSENSATAKTTHPNRTEEKVHRI